MTQHRVISEDSMSAMDEISKVLGNDAVILSTKKNNGKIEIIGSNDIKDILKSKKSKSKNLKPNFHDLFTKEPLQSSTISNNKNGLIEPAEVIKATMYVRNNGQQIAQNVSIQVLYGDFVFNTGKSSFNLGDIKKDQKKKVQFSFFANTSSAFLEILGAIITSTNCRLIIFSAVSPFSSSLKAIIPPNADSGSVS